MFAAQKPTDVGEEETSLCIVGIGISFAVLVMNSVVTGPVYYCILGSTFQLVLKNEYFYTKLIIIKNIELENSSLFIYILKFLSTVCIEIIDIFPKYDKIVYKNINVISEMECKDEK